MEASGAKDKKHYELQRERVKDKDSKVLWSLPLAYRAA